MDQANYLAAKKLFETYDLRVADNSLSVDNEDQAAERIRIAEEKLDIARRKKK